MNRLSLHRSLEHIPKGLLIVFLLSILVGCSSTDSNPEQKKVFRYNMPSALNSLDPAFAKDQASIWTINQLFNGLVQLDEDLNVQPCLAERWETSADGKQITFHLRKSVYFQENNLFETKEDRMVRASDVVYSFNRIIDPAVASPGAWIFNGRVADKNPFQALDDFTVVVNLKQSFQPILGILTMQYCSVLSEKIAEHYGKKLREHPVGTGPFQLKNWRENDVLVLEKFTEYWEKDANGKTLPHLDFVRTTFSENKKNAWLGLLEGDLDFISGIDPAYTQEALDEEGNLQAAHADKINLNRSPYLNTEYLGFNTSLDSHPILQNKLLRKAMNYAIDREKMVKYLRNNIGLPAGAGFIPAGLPSHNPSIVKGYDFQPKKAQALLREAGYPEGKGLPELKLETTSAYKDLCIFIQKQLNDAGFNVQVELSPPSLLREKISKGNAAFFRASWLADYPDGENYLTVFWSGNPAPPNYTRFNNPTFDALYQAALLETDPQKRQGLYQAMDKIIVEEAPVIPLFYDEVMRFSSKRVKGLGSNANNLLILKNVDLD